MEYLGKLKYAGNTFRMWQDSRKMEYSIFKIPTTERIKLYEEWDGDTNWDSYSDRRLKTNIEEEEDILERVTQLKVKNFNWKDDPNNKRKMIGFIAQDVQPLFPTLVKENNDKNSNEKKVNDTLCKFWRIREVGAIKELKDEKDAEIFTLREEIKKISEEAQSATENNLRIVNNLKEENKKQVELLNKQQQQFADLSAKVEQLLRK